MMLLSQGVSYWDPPALLAARRPQQPGSQQQRRSQRHIPPSLHSAHARTHACTRTPARSSPAHRLAHTEPRDRLPSPRRAAADPGSRVPVRRRSAATVCAPSLRLAPALCVCCPAGKHFGRGHGLSASRMASPPSADSRRHGGRYLGRAAGDGGGSEAAEASLTSCESESELLPLPLPLPPAAGGPAYAAGDRPQTASSRPGIWHH